MNTTALNIVRPSYIEPAPRQRSPVLETPRLTLRALDEQDILAMTALTGNPNVASRVWNMPQPYTIADAGRFLRRTRDPDTGVTAFAITLGETDALLGCIKIDMGDDATDRQIGFWLGEPHWNRGYMTEATQAVVEHAFSTAPSLLHVAAHVRVNDPATRRVLAKCGFQYVGPAREVDIRLGSFVAADRYVIDRGIWSALKAWARRH
jgi:RimJ/RimL family protein N-acetyltransferase